MSAVKRRNVTLPESSIARISAIRQKTEATSDSEVIRRALRLYESLLESEAVVQDKNGRTLPVAMY